MSRGPCFCSFHPWHRPGSRKPLLKATEGLQEGRPAAGRVALPASDRGMVGSRVSIRPLGEARPWPACTPHAYLCCGMVPGWAARLGLPSAPGSLHGAPLVSRAGWAVGGQAVTANNSVAICGSAVATALTTGAVLVFVGVLKVPLRAGSALTGCPPRWGFPAAPRPTSHVLTCSLTLMSSQTHTPSHPHPPLPVTRLPFRVVPPNSCPQQCPQGQNSVTAQGCK